MQDYCIPSYILWYKKKVVKIIYDFYFQEFINQNRNYYLIVLVSKCLLDKYGLINITVVCKQILFVFYLDQWCINIY